MMKLMRSKKGASSILVILMLVVLVVFGVAALTTALSSVRLGQKVEDWNEKYYTAEAKANKVYAQIDKVITDEPWPTISSRHPIELLTQALPIDIHVALDGDACMLDYEVWEEDVGISVVLKYDFETETLYPTQWKEVQKQQ